MKYSNVSLLFLLCFTVQLIYAQYPQGTVVTDHLYSELLENSGGEDPSRRITIYLPPGYEESDQRYPVIYYLHGFTWDDSLTMRADHLDYLLDNAIATGKIRPVIVVAPNQYTLYRGSFYTNSSLTGKWADFTGTDLVDFIDAKYRTIKNPESRGVAGHSMGGQGAVKMGMLFPEVFSVVYALSPAVLDIEKELGYNGWGYRRLPEIHSREQLVTGWAEFYPNAIVAMARAYSPNPDNPPFYIDVPYTYENGVVTVNHEVLEAWKEKSVMGMVDDYAKSLEKLKALKLDWGRNEEHEHIPATCREFSQMLEELGIEHYAEEYIGDHVNKLWTEDGRALNDMLPFFNLHLEFPE